MPQIGPVELAIIVIIALIVVGPGKLPDVGAALGKSIREFRKAATDVKDSTRLEPVAESNQASASASSTSAPAASVSTPATPPAAPASPAAEPAEPAGAAPESTTDSAGR
jgi:TatA/E family protein of Tat protein translocase